MLALTPATVLAIEPSPQNLFYLTSTLHAAAVAHDEYASRVAVLPVAVGEASGESPIFAEDKNAGNTMLLPNADAVEIRSDLHPTRPKKKMLPVGSVGARVPVRTLASLARPFLSELASSLAPPGRSHSSSAARASATGRNHDIMLKIDSQGYECNVLRGASSELLQQVRVLVAEVWPVGLQANNCSAAELERLVRAAGFPHVQKSQALGDVTLIAHRGQAAGGKD